MQKKKKIIYFVAPLLALVALMGGWLYSRSSLFRLSDIQVHSEEVELAKEIRSVLYSYLGKSLFSLPLGRLEKDLLKVSKVDSLTLNLKWPSTLIIEVQAKDPVAMMFIGGVLWTIDNTGTALQRMGQPDPLPLLKNVNLKTPETREFLAWLGTAEGHPLSSLDVSKFEEISWDAERGFIFKSYELGLDLDLGRQNFDRAWSHADLAFTELQSRGVYVTHMDATYASRVVVRPSRQLQNYKNELNLEELVRRKDKTKAAAR